MGFILSVPLILDFGKLLGGVFGTKGKESFCIVGFAFCMQVIQSIE